MYYNINNYNILNYNVIIVLYVLILDMTYHVIRIITINMYQNYIIRLILVTFVKENHQFITWL